MPVQYFETNFERIRSTFTSFTEKDYAACYQRLKSDDILFTSGLCHCILYITRLSDVIKLNLKNVYNVRIGVDYR